MAFQSVPNTAEIAIEFLLADQQVINTYHAELPTGYVQNDLNVLSGLIDIHAGGAFMSVFSVHLSYVQTTVRGLHSQNDLIAVSNASAGVGALGVQSSPPTVAFAVQKLSGFTGRSARGRVYLSGIPITDLEPGTPNVGKILQSAADGYRDVVDGFRNVIAGSPGWTPVIVSRYTGGVKRASGVTFPWSSTSYTNRELDTMRSRSTN